MKKICSLTIWLFTFWPAVTLAQSRFAIDEALREGGQIWEWILLFLMFYLAGLISLFIACIVKFRRHSSRSRYCATCFRIAKGEVKMFSVIAFGYCLAGIALLVPASFIILFIIEIGLELFFNFQIERLLIIWTLSTTALILIGSIVFSLRGSLHDLKGEEYFQSIEKLEND